MKLLLLVLFGLALISLIIFFQRRPRVMWLIFLLRIVGDRKSADRFIRHLKMIDRANASPHYNFDGINKPKKYITDMPKFSIKKKFNVFFDIYETKRIKVDLHVYYCINSQGKFVATTDYGQHWYLTGEDDAEWRKEVSYKKLAKPKRIVRRDRMLKR